MQSLSLCKKNDEQTGGIMGRASIEYINKDYESIRQELLAKVPQLTDRWTDFNHSDLGVVLLELFCGVGDMLSYYLD
ncbi:[weak similarity to] baseplate J family protein, partial [methanotrophic bacterial endosymbiont of Bathymodiolus sp.]